jgi:hypothetical protein
MKEARALGWILLIIAVLLLSGCTSSTNKNSNQPGNQNSLDSDHDGIPDSVEKTLGTDPFNNDTDGDGVSDLNDTTPTFVDNPPAPSTGPQGFAILQILVENNYDQATQQVVPDHLEIVLHSTINKDISNITVYYVIRDAKINKTESYLKPLKGFVLKANETRHIHFDAGGLPDHFRVNPNSIYYTNADEKIFTVTVNAVGYAAQTMQVKKDAGTVEGPD